MTDDPPDSNPLAIPDTRPNMFLLVPYGLAVLFGVAFFAIDTQLHSLVDGFVVVPFWIGAALLVRRDVNGLRVFMVRCRLTLTLLDAHRWGGQSVTPWPLKGKRGERHAL